MTLPFVQCPRITSWTKKASLKMHFEKNGLEISSKNSIFFVAQYSYFKVYYLQPMWSGPEGNYALV